MRGPANWVGCCFKPPVYTRMYIYIYLYAKIFILFLEIYVYLENLPKQNNTVYKDVMLGDIILAHIKLYITKIKIGSLFGFGMLQNLQKKKIGLIPHRVM